MCTSVNCLADSVITPSFVRFTPTLAEMGKGDTNFSVVFHINGERHTVDAASGIGVKTMLADYIRDEANLKGTKVMCREGGCGACLVTAKVIDPVSGAEVVKSVNSCLTPVMSCGGWDISTVERLGNKHEGYHLIQSRLVNFHGTQCGFCTPGMVMNMYSSLASTKDVRMEDVEKNLDGNICRCTGYRPILDAFKSLTSDVSDELKQKCADIEDCNTCPLRQEAFTCLAPCHHARVSTENRLKFSTGEEWITAKTLESALSTATQCKKDGRASRFVAGNTSTGIFKNDGPYKVFIDINGIPELKRKIIDHHGLHLGSGSTITETINLLKESSSLPGLQYGSRVASHLERVANFSVRNNGTIGGNLMIKHSRRDFPSDIFTILEALGATLTIASLRSQKSLIGSEKTKLDDTLILSLTEFLDTEMTAKLITTIHLPRREGYHFRSFKITRRYQNAHAYLNAAFLLKVNEDNAFKVEDRPRIVYGGISPSFTHASATEISLFGRSLSDGKTLESAFQSLEAEVKPDSGPLQASAEYRLQLAKSLLYKAILGLLGNNVGDRERSGMEDLVRSDFRGKQTLDRGLGEIGLYKAVPKYEGPIQASGEAEYTGDIPIRKDELFGAFVLSTVANADLLSMDASEALEMPDVVKFVTGKNIPGVNNAMSTGFFPTKTVEPVFTTDKVSYHGQALGLILATSKAAAVTAAKLVKVTYNNIEKPVIHISEAIVGAQEAGTLAYQTVGTHSTPPDDKVKVEHTVTGKLNFGSQYHFYMETQTCVCHPREDGVDVYSSTQFMDHVQNEVALVLKLPTNSVNVQVRRLGGGFGGKITRPAFVATACALGCWLTNRPVRIVLDLETNMTMLGKRLPYEIPYEVGFDNDGRIGKLDLGLTCDSGWASNEETIYIAAFHAQNAYKSNGWTVKTNYVTTNTPSNTFCRAPGTIQSSAAMEWIMDRIAAHRNLDPLTVRKVNFLERGDGTLFGAVFDRDNMLPEMIAQMKEEAEYDRRRTAVEEFNNANRWKKRGLGVVPIRYPIFYFGAAFPATVAIYHMDGHLAVSTGGIEMGQGLNTKVIQTVAHILQIPLDRIKVKPSNNFVAANAFCTGASITSELVCYSVSRACEQLRENLKPILEKLENPSWDKLVEEAYKAKVKLSATHLSSPADECHSGGYDVWVLNLTEVEIDVLTGEYRILRTDLYEDTGKSLSPGVDLGQIEGGYMFGQGFWTTERIVHDEKTGKLLTNGTWDYKPPLAKDIPEDFRITLLSNSPNPHGVLRSKATGEPSTDSAFAVVLALRNAIASARKDAGNTEWFEMSNGVTPEDVARLCLTSQSSLTL